MLVFLSRPSSRTATMSFDQRVSSGGRGGGRDIGGYGGGGAGGGKGGAGYQRESRAATLSLRAATRCRAAMHFS
jgi:hypothetical protein